MTTRTMPETHEARVREMAEELVSSVPSDLYGTHPSIPDPRFASLRGEHRWIDFTDEGGSRFCFYEADDDEEGHKHGSYCLRTDGDALTEAVAACGFEFGGGRVISTGNWSIGLSQRHVRVGDGARITSLPSISVGIGPTFRDAVSMALWTAVFGA